MIKTHLAKSNSSSEETENQARVAKTNTFGRKLARIVFKTLRLFYVSWNFYFMPYSALFVPYVAEISRLQ